MCHRSWCTGSHDQFTSNKGLAIGGRRKLNNFSQVIKEKKSSLKAPIRTCLRFFWALICFRTFLRIRNRPLEAPLSHRFNYWMILISVSGEAATLKGPAGTLYTLLPWLLHGYLKPVSIFYQTQALPWTPILLPQWVNEGKIPTLWESITLTPSRPTSRQEETMEYIKGEGLVSDGKYSMSLSYDESMNV